MTRNFDERTRSTALALIGQYGGDAEVIAVMRAAEYTAVGDVEALAAWDTTSSNVLRRLKQERLERGRSSSRAGNLIARRGIPKQTPLPVVARLYWLQHQNGTTRWTSPCC
jgi:hypothetical protein